MQSLERIEKGLKRKVETVDVRHVVEETAVEINLISQKMVNKIRGR